MAVQCVCSEGGSTYEDMALFRIAIERNEPQLIRQIQVGVMFWAHLQSQQVLTEDLIGECKAEVSLFHLIIFGLWKMLVIRSTRRSRPNKVGLKCPYVRPSVCPQ